MMLILLSIESPRAADEAFMVFVSQALGCCRVLRRFSYLLIVSFGKRIYEDVMEICLYRLLEFELFEIEVLLMISRERVCEGVWF